MTQILHDSNHLPANPEPEVMYTRQRSVLLDHQPETIIIIMTDSVLDGKVYPSSIKVTTITERKNEATYYNIVIARQVIAEYDRWQAELASQV